MIEAEVRLDGGGAGRRQWVHAAALGGSATLADVLSRCVPAAAGLPRAVAEVSSPPSAGAAHWRPLELSAAVGDALPSGGLVRFTLPHPAPGPRRCSGGRAAVAPLVCAAAASAAAFSGGERGGQDSAQRAQQAAAAATPDRGPANCSLAAPAPPPPNCSLYLANRLLSWRDWTCSPPLRCTAAAPSAPDPAALLRWLRQGVLWLLGDSQMRMAFSLLWCILDSVGAVEAFAYRRHPLPEGRWWTGSRMESYADWREKRPKMYAQIGGTQEGEWVVTPAPSAGPGAWGGGKGAAAWEEATQGWRGHFTYIRLPLVCLVLQGGGAACLRDLYRCARNAKGLKGLVSASSTWGFDFDRPADWLRGPAPPPLPGRGGWGKERLLVWLGTHYFPRPLTPTTPTAAHWRADLQDALAALGQQRWQGVRVAWLPSLPQFFPTPDGEQPCCGCRQHPRGGRCAKPRRHGVWRNAALREALAAANTSAGAVAWAALPPVDSLRGERGTMLRASWPPADCIHFCQDVYGSLVALGAHAAGCPDCSSSGPPGA